MMRLVLLFFSKMCYASFMALNYYFERMIFSIYFECDDYSMLVAIQYISFSQCSAQASLSEYSELQYSSAATNHLHTISESPLLTLPSLYYHSVHDPLLFFPVIKIDITTRRKYEPAVKVCHFSPSSAFVGSESPTSYQQEQFSTIRRLWSTMLKLVLFSATSISCNSRRLRGAQRGAQED